MPSSASVPPTTWWTDAALRTSISNLVTLLVGYISRHQWSPNDDITSTFLVRPEELQMLVQVAHHVNPSNTVSAPFYTPPVSLGVDVDVLGLGSYFKFNLDYMTFFNLVRLQNNSSNRGAYQTIREATYAHENAFFDIVDHALGLPDAGRDAEVRNLLNQLLAKSTRDFYVDMSKTVATCTNEACRPIPVPLRPPTDFLWQRDPFQLTGGGDGMIESAGIDYLLPYWMARYYGVIGPDPAVQSSAAPNPPVAPNSLASLYGANLAAGTAQSTVQPLPLTLGGVRATVTDSAGVQRNAPLSFVAQGQMNFLIPDGTATGAATVRVGSQAFAATVQNVAPALYSMNGTGTGVAAATAIHVQVSNPQLQSPVPVFQCAAAGCSTVPIQLGVDTPLYLTLYGTGIRNRTSLSNVIVTIAGFPAPVLYAGPSPGYDGLDQVNVLVTLLLRGAGESNVLLTVDGQVSNAVRVSVQ